MVVVCRAGERSRVQADRVEAGRGGGTGGTSDAATCLRAPPGVAREPRTPRGPELDPLAASGGRETGAWMRRSSSSRPWRMSFGSCCFGGRSYVSAVLFEFDEGMAAAAAGGCKRDCVSRGARR